MIENAAEMRPDRAVPQETQARYRVGRHQPQNIYEGDAYIGVMFSPEHAARVVEALNRTDRLLAAEKWFTCTTV